MKRSDSMIAAHGGRLSIQGAAVALGLATTLLCSPARAADPNVSITVTPIPTAVSLRVATSTTQAAYRVDIVNQSTNVLNDVRFTASTRVFPSATLVRTPYVEDTSDQCAASQNVLNCSFGQVRGSGQPGQNGRSFIVVFDAPFSGERLFLDWSATYKEGTSDSSGNPPNNDTQSSTDPGKAVFTTLVSSEAVSDKQLRSYFAAATGALLFTSTAVPKGPPSEDTWTTSVRIPSGTAGEARIVEDSEPASCNPVIPTCVRSAVNVPGSFVDATPTDGDQRFLVITLRRDASTIPNGAQIAKSPLYYEPGSIDANGVFQPSGSTQVQLKLCADIGGAPSLPTAGSPLDPEQQKRCIKSFQAYPKNAKAPPGLEGDWEWIIWAIENGRISF